MRTSKEQDRIMRILRDLEDMDAVDTMEIQSEIVLAFGIDQVVDWLNHFEQQEMDGYNIVILDQEGNKVFQ